jgi:plasmid stability protein
MPMPTLTIRNIDADLKDGLRQMAARDGCSMDEEMRRILRRSLLQEKSTMGIASRIHSRFADNPIDLQAVERSAPRASQTEAD